MKTKEIRILALVLAVCLVMHITTVKAQTTAPFTITHSNGGSFEFRADGKLVATGNSPWGLGTFSWNPSLGILSYGVGSTASGYFSTATGYGSTATGGFSTATGYFSTASGEYSTASGYGSTATGWYSTASGHYSTATGYGSTATGNGSMASGWYSTATGYGSTATGEYSMASGPMVQAQSKHAFAIGVLNIGGGNPTQWVPTDPLFEIGNGGNGSWAGNPAINERSNALTVYKNGNMEVNGNADFQGVVTCAPGGDIPMFNPAP